MQSRFRRRHFRYPSSKHLNLRKKRIGKTWGMASRGFEHLETRNLLTADLVATGLTGNGTDLVVDYDITGASVGNFNISIYRSTNGTTLGTLLTTKQITASVDRQIGSHSTTIAGNFNDVQQDYYLMVKVDAANEISETSESNNTLRMDEGVFRTSDGSVHVHGSDDADDVSISISGSNLYVDHDSTQYTYTASGVASVRVRSHGGDDTITMAIDADKILWGIGGSGTDTISGGAAADLVAGGAGNDWIHGYGGNDTLVGENGDDTLYGGDGNDLIYGVADNDILYGGAGNDSITAGAGDDLLYGEDGDDTMLGDAGNDVLEGGAGNDIIDGGQHADTFVFQGSGNLGTDYFIENAAFGAGDTLDFSGLSTAINLELGYANGATQVVNGLFSLKMANCASVENVIGTDSDDAIFGNAAANVIEGGDGEDWIEGGDGNDILSGGDGDDFLFGMQGHDMVYGGDGEDWLYGDDTCYCYGGDDYLFGGDGDDYLYGSLGNDYLDGGTGVDSLFGDDGINTLVDRPQIVDFVVVHDAGTYIFTGRVLDDTNPEGLIVAFGGLLEGYTATVEENGTFMLVVEDDEIESTGEVNVETTDAEGLTSESSWIVL